MNIDLSEMSRDDLLQLQKQIKSAIKSFEARRMKEALAAAQAAASEHGFSLADLTGAPKAKRAAPAKYQHPENPEVTWSGRGRKPAWFAELVDAGHSAEDLLITPL